MPDVISLLSQHIAHRVVAIGITPGPGKNYDPEAHPA
jgi:hypothetical protein